MMKRALSILALSIVAAGAALPARADENFGRWMDTLKQDAANAGIPRAVIEVALNDVTPVPRIIELDQRQPENTVTLQQYLANVVTPARIERGGELMQENRTALRRVQGEYGVPPQTVMALWAIESNYGRVTGNYRVVDALTTLAYDGRRPELFRSELIDALKILSRGTFTPAELKGSWAGAMGQTQFMPSTYLRYAVAARGNRDPDIWQNEDDVFASTANYLARLGWKRGENWGREVKLPKRFDPGLLGHATRKSVDEWAALGVRRADGTKLPVSNFSASLVAPDGIGGRAFLVYDNFRTVMQWNRSTYFALAVGQLSDAIAAR